MQLWEITQALAPTQFLIVLIGFLLAFRANRKREKKIDVLGMHPLWAMCILFWFGPIYDLIISPSILPDLFSGELFPYWQLAYSIFPIFMTLFVYTGFYLWKSNHKFGAVLYIFSVSFYTSIVFDYREEFNFISFLRHPLLAASLFLLLFFAILWAKNVRRRCLLFCLLLLFFITGMYFIR